MQIKTLISLVVFFWGIFYIAFADIKVDKYDLDGSSKFFVIKNSALVLPAVGIVVSRGAKFDPPNYYGITHLWEHLFFRNEVYQKSLKDWLVINQYNATTYNDYIAFYSLASFNTMKLFLHALFYPNFSYEVFNLEKSIVVSELAMNNFSSFQFFKVYTNPTGGTIDTINNISYNAMIDFMKSITKSDVSFFVISNKEFDQFDIFNGFYTNIKKEKSFDISIDPRQDLYDSYKEFPKFVGNLDFSSRLDRDSLWFYSSVIDPSYEDIFLQDLISRYINYKFSNDLGIKKRFLEEFGVGYLNAFCYPQNKESILVVSLNLYNDKKIDVTNLKKYLLSILNNMTFNEYVLVYRLAYSELIDSFSNSWSICQIIPYFIYNDNWQLLNYYFRGCLD